MSAIPGPSGPAAWHNWAGPLAFVPVPGAGQAPFGLEDVDAPLHELLLTQAASIERGMDRTAATVRLSEWSSRLESRLGEMGEALARHDARWQGIDPIPATAVAERRVLIAQTAQLQSLVDWIGAAVADRDTASADQPDLAAHRDLWTFRQLQTAVAVTYAEYTQAAAGRYMGVDFASGPHTPGMALGRANDAYYNMMFALAGFERRACIRVLDSAEAAFIAQWRLYKVLGVSSRPSLAVQAAATGVELLHLVRTAGDVACCYPHLPDFQAAAEVATRGGDVHLPPIDVLPRDLHADVLDSNLRAHFVREAGANGSLHAAIAKASARLVDQASATGGSISEACTHALGLTMKAHGDIRAALVEFRTAVAELLWNEDGLSPMELDLASRAAERSSVAEPAVRDLPETAEYVILMGFEASDERIDQASDLMMTARASLATAIGAMASVPELGALRDVAKQVMDKMFALPAQPSGLHAAMSEFVDAVASYGPAVRGRLDDAEWIEAAVAQILSPEADALYFATQGPGGRPLVA